MWNYVLSGVVYPERALLDLGNSIPCRIVVHSVGIAGDALIGIYKNQITVAFASEQEVSDWMTLKFAVSDTVSVLVDAAALNAVVGYDIEIRTMHCIQTGFTRVFGADVPGLSIGEHEFIAMEISPLVATAQEPLFRRALGDFKRSIRYPVDSGFFCYRAVESLVNFVMDEQGSAKPAAILALEQMLNIHVDCIQLLRRLGADVRHGKISGISSEDRMCAIKITREILLRFSECLRARPGPSPTFSLLAP